MTYSLEETVGFCKSFDKLPYEIQKRFEKQFRRIIDNPYGYGRPLGSKYFRELKQGSFQVYYCIYNTGEVILLAGVSDKDSQQKIIDIIK